ncbi:MAG: hypothetical protein HYT27_02840 [Parcubacteria group bacterium]|nr:hypothetical protein [Parcubacteria group bacterium]
MEAHLILNTLAGLLAIGGFFPYITSVLKEETKPNKATWVVWTSLTCITAIGMWDAGTLNAQVTAIAIGDMIVLALAFKFGVPEWSNLDRFCLIGAGVGLLLWAVTGNPITAVVVSLLIIFVGSVPTMVKTWHNPSWENVAAYAFMAASSVVTIVAIPLPWSVANAAQPLVFFCTAGTILALTQKKHPHSLIHRLTS